MANHVVLDLLGTTKNITLGPLIRGTGIPVPCYPDIRGLLADPKNLKIIASECVTMIRRSHDVNLIAACSMGGIALAVAVSLEIGLPMIILRKRSRSYAYSLIDGLYKRGQRAVLIDDSIVTGASQKSFVENLLKAKIKPIRLLTIIDVGGSPVWQKQRRWLHDHGVVTESLITWTEWALYMRDRRRIPRATVQTILKLMEHPPKWAEEPSA